jgi:hypothetical protein
MLQVEPSSSPDRTVVNANMSMDPEKTHDSRHWSPSACLDLAATNPAVPPNSLLALPVWSQDTTATPPKSPVRMTLMPPRKCFDDQCQGCASMPTRPSSVQLTIKISNSQETVEKVLEIEDSASGISLDSEPKNVLLTTTLSYLNIRFHFQVLQYNPPSPPLIALLK